MAFKLAYFSRLTHLYREFLVFCLIVLATCLYAWLSVPINSGPDPVQNDFLLQQLLAESERPISNQVLNSVERKCPMYSEFRRLNLLHPVFRHKLCQNVEVYKLYPDGYPMCQLPNPFNENMLEIVRRGSDIVQLFDTQEKLVEMFVYKGPDHISLVLKKYNAWEPEIVKRTIGFARKLSDVTFLDIGSNIGVYSLQAAKLGLPVVAVDANIRNLLRLRLSLDAASLNADLVWNFIASDQKLKHLSFLSDCNVGGAGRDKADLPDTIAVMPLESERLRNLIRTKKVVMKMDIQGGETDFLETSGRLFTDFNVAAVQMEWSPTMIHGDDSVILAGFFTARGYKGWRVPDFTALDINNIDGWGNIDILWIHKDFQGVDSI